MCSSWIMDASLTLVPPAVWAHPGCRGARPRASASSHPHPARSDLCASRLSASAGDRLEPPGGICRSWRQKMDICPWRRRLTPLSRLTDAHLTCVVSARFHVRFGVSTRGTTGTLTRLLWEESWMATPTSDQRTPDRWDSVTHSGKITLCYKLITTMINIDAGYDVMIWREWQLYLDKNKQQ